MNELKVINNEVRISSLDLVKIINEKRSDEEAVLTHAHFLQKVSKVLNGDEAQYRSIYKDAYSRDKPCYRFPKREACLLAMSYSYALQAKVYDYMTELENKNTPKLPTTYKEALLALVEQVEINEQQSKQLQLDKPFSNFGKSIANSSESIPIGNYAKLLNNDGINIGRNKLFSLLRENGYLIKSGRSANSPFQKYIEMKIFEIKETVLNSIKGGLVCTTTLVTGKGQMYLLDKIKDLLNK